MQFVLLFFFVFFSFVGSLCSNAMRFLRSVSCLEYISNFIKYKTPNIIKGYSKLICFNEIEFFFRNICNNISLSHLVHFLLHLNDLNKFIKSYNSFYVFKFILNLLIQVLPGFFFK